MEEDFITAAMIVANGDARLAMNKRAMMGKISSPRMA